MVKRPLCLTCTRSGGAKSGVMVCSTRSALAGTAEFTKMAWGSQRSQHDESQTDGVEDDVTGQQSGRGGAWRL